MAEKKEGKVTFADRWNGLKAEFGKIVWPDGQTIYKQSVAVILATILIALLIVFFDMIIQYGVDFLVNLSF
ncbi:MAG: preprotein translocase subunit SecE [Lachnospiraceae bacterium]|nr:preprotein translocase subunit SecE [Lachnospiraceae bacterium]